MTKWKRKSVLYVNSFEDRTCPAFFTPANVTDLQTAIITALTNGEDDTITLAATTFAFSAADNNIAGGNALPVITDDAGTTITVNGNGAILTLAPLSERMRFFTVDGGQLILNSLQLVGGRPEFGDGGAVLVQAGQFDANACLFRNNFTDFDGGAVAYLAGTTGGLLSNSTFTANASLASNETLTPQGGGAIAINMPSRAGTPVVIVRHCTIVANTVDPVGGETFAAGGGLLLVGGGTVEIENTVIADNLVNNEPDDVFQETVETQLGVDFVGTIDTRNSLIQANLDAVNGSQINLLPINSDPRLGTLSNNGGLTPTFALLAGSPLINAGDNAFVTGQTDQRGPNFARISDGIVDIGAFEVQERRVRLSLVQSAAQTRRGQLVTFTMTIQGNVGGPKPTGTVAFYDNGRFIGRVLVDASGRARLRTANLVVGRHTITAVYSGDVNYDRGSRSVIHTVLGSLVGRRWDR